MPEKIVTRYVWQSLSTSSSKSLEWLTDIHAFASLEDALEIGLTDHTNCRAHSQHRIVAITFSVPSNEHEIVRAKPIELLGMCPVYSVIQSKEDNPCQEV